MCMQACFSQPILAVETGPMSKYMTDSVSPQIIIMFSQGCVTSLMALRSAASHFNRLLAALAVNPHRDLVSFSVVICVVMEKKKSRLSSPNYQPPNTSELRPDALRC